MENPTPLADLWERVKKTPALKGADEHLVEMLEASFYMGAASANICHRRLIQPIKDELKAWESKLDEVLLKRKGKGYVPPTIPDDDTYDDREPHDG